MSRTAKILSALEEIAHGFSKEGRAEKAAEKAAATTAKTEHLTDISEAASKISPALAKDAADFEQRLTNFADTVKSKGLLEASNKKPRDADAAMKAVQNGEKITPQELKAIRDNETAKFVHYSKGGTAPPVAGTAQAGTPHIPPVISSNPFTAAISGLTGAVSRAPMWVKAPLVALGVVHVMAVDNPLSPGQEPLGVQMYKSYEGIKQGKPQAEIAAAVAQAKATTAESQQTEINARAAANTTAVLEKAATSVLAGGQNQASLDTLATYFKTVVKKTVGEIDENTLDGYAKQFTTIAKGLDIDRSGALSNDERFGFANSKEFISMMEKMKANPEQKSAIIRELIPM